MAASMRNVFQRSILGNIQRIRRSKQCLPIAAFCDVTADKESALDFFLDKIDSTYEDIVEEKVEEKQSFATLFRNSGLVQMGDLKDKTMAGRIVDVVGDDLYIDIGAKFYCVCKRPARQEEQYRKQQRVKVYMHKLEMSSSFLGSEKHVTLLEADCTLTGTYNPSDQSPKGTEEAKTEEDKIEEAKTPDYIKRLLSEEDIKTSSENPAYRPDT